MSMPTAPEISGADGDEFNQLGSKQLYIPCFTYFRRRNKKHMESFIKAVNISLKKTCYNIVIIMVYCFTIITI